MIGRTILASGSRNEIKLWSVDDGVELRTIVGHAGWVRCVSVNEDAVYWHLAVRIR